MPSKGHSGCLWTSTATYEGRGVIKAAQACCILSKVLLCDSNTTAAGTTGARLCTMSRPKHVPDAPGACNYCWLAHAKAGMCVHTAMPACVGDLRADGVNCV
jgi:hypothetical protein